MSKLSIVNPRSLESPVLRCGVCGFAEVRTDEVAEQDLLLGECPRCEHRWTGRRQPVLPSAPGVARVRVLDPVEEAATAA